MTRSWDLEIGQYITVKWKCMYPFLSPSTPPPPPSFKDLLLVNGIFKYAWWF